MKSISLLGLATCVWLSFACQNTKEETSEEVSSYPTTSPIQVDTTMTTDYVAEIVAIRNVEIRSRINGYLEKVLVDEGRNVKQGQLLFVVGNPELAGQLAKASAVLKSAKAEVYAAELDVRNVKQLVDKGVVSNTELEMAKNKVAIARAKVEEVQAEEANAKVQVSYLEIRAPFSGIVNRIPNKIGSLLEEKTLLTTLSQNEEVYAYFDVSEREYLNFAIMQQSTPGSGREVALRLANNALHPHKGFIETTEGEISPSTGNIAFRAKFSNPQRVLKHGASGRVLIKRQLNNAILIPQKATFEIQDRVYVYTVDASKKIKAQEVQVSQRLPHYFVVTQGVTTRDQIVVEGLQELREGQEIQSQFVPMRTLMAKLITKS